MSEPSPDVQQYKSDVSLQLHIQGSFDGIYIVCTADRGCISSTDHLYSHSAYSVMYVIPPLQHFHGAAYCRNNPGITRPPEPKFRKSRRFVFRHNKQLGTQYNRNWCVHGHICHHRKSYVQILFRRCMHHHIRISGDRQRCANIIRHGYFHKNKDSPHSLTHCLWRAISLVPKP